MIRSIRSIFCWLSLAFVALCFITLGFILFLGFSDNIQPADVAVILGNQVHRNGQPYSRLAARLDEGITLYQAGLFKHIIVSGGIERNGRSEAVVMHNYLVAHHIPSSAIIEDSHGSNTWHTALNSKVIMQKNGYKSVLVISQYFHIARTVLSFMRCGVSPIYHAHAKYFEWQDLYSTPREVLGIYYYLLFHFLSYGSVATTGA